MKFLKDMLYIILIGQGVVWSVVYMSYLLPSVYVSFMLGIVGCAIGKIAYRLIEERV